MQLAELRSKFAKRENYPERVWKALKDTNATSDDEVDAKDPTIYHIKLCPERSEHWTRFIRLLDAKREAEAKLLGPRHAPRSSRVPGNEPSEHVTLPTDIPMDWFNPDVFNNYSFGLRATYAKNPTIGLPADFDLVIRDPAAPVTATTEHDRLLWKKMPPRQFMQVHGKDILSRYELPTADDMAPPDSDDDEDLMEIQLDGNAGGNGADGDGAGGAAGPGATGAGAGAAGAGAAGDGTAGA